MLSMVRGKKTVAVGLVVYGVFGPYIVSFRRSADISCRARTPISRCGICNSGSASRIHAFYSHAPVSLIRAAVTSGVFTHRDPPLVLRVTGRARTWPQAASAWPASRDRCT